MGWDEIETMQTSTDSIRRSDGGRERKGERLGGRRVEGEEGERRRKKVMMMDPYTAGVGRKGHVINVCSGIYTITSIYSH